MFKLELPYCIGENITFKVDNSPDRHGKVIDFISFSYNNTINITGCKVKCKNGVVKYVNFKDILGD